MFICQTLGYFYFNHKLGLRRCQTATFRAEKWGLNRRDKSCSTSKRPLEVIAKSKFISIYCMYSTVIKTCVQSILQKAVWVFIPYFTFSDSVTVWGLPGGMFICYPAQKHWSHVRKRYLVSCFHGSLWHTWNSSLDGFGLGCFFSNCWAISIILFNINCLWPFNKAE